jgi:hypothetical protein
MYCLFCVVLCIVCVYMCTVLLPLGGYPIAVKYIISYLIISYHIIKPNKSLFFAKRLSNVKAKTSNACKQILASYVISSPSLKVCTLLIINNFMTKWHAPPAVLCSWSGRPAGTPRTQDDYHHDTKVKPVAATAVIALLMIGGKTPETCWAVNKCQNNKLKICCIRLVIYLN